MTEIINVLLQNSKLVVLILIYGIIFIPGVKKVFKKAIIEVFNGLVGTVLSGTISLTLIAIIAENKLNTSFQLIVLDNFIFYFFMLIVIFSYKFKISQIKDMSIAILVSCIMGLYPFATYYLV